MHWELMHVTQLAIPRLEDSVPGVRLLIPLTVKLRSPQRLLAAPKQFAKCSEVYCYRERPSGLPSSDKRGKNSRTNLAFAIANYSLAYVQLSCPMPLRDRFGDLLPQKLVSRSY
jgi:hypothetical protein